MTIRRGQRWGEPGSLGTNGTVVDNDADLVVALLSLPDHVSDASVGLVGGDLHRTIGAPRGGEQRLRSGDAWVHPIDLGEVVIRRSDGAEEHLWFCAHVVAIEGAPDRGALATGSRAPLGADVLFSARSLVVMNAAFLGEANLGPRAHPNDGLLDITDGRLGWWDRRRARLRMRTGTHVPHPSLHQERIRHTEVTFERTARVRVDGVGVGAAVGMSITCHPDAASVVA